MTATNTQRPMTASKIWALIAALILVGGGAIGGVLYYRQHPDMPQVARLLESVPTKTPPAAPQSKAPPKPTEATPATPAPQAGPAPAPPAEVAKAPPAEISKEQPVPAKPEPPTGNGEPPHFDVVRVEPSGETVVAGKGAPDSKVALVASGKVVAEAKTDASGQFVILPPPLKPGDHDLSLRETPDGKPAVDSKQNVAVSVPKKPGDQVVVALAEPGQPTKLLTAPPEAAAPAKAPEAKAPEAKPAVPAAPTKPDSKVAVAKPDTTVTPPAETIGLAIRSAELENGTGFFASGVARSGTQIEVYLNGSHLAGVVAGPDKQWTVTVRKGLAAGHYNVRADAIEGRSVVARVEVPFDVPVAMAEAPAPAKQPAQPPASATAPPAPQTSVAAAEPAPPAVSKEPSPVPIPRPDVAARAKAAVAAAPAIAPPTLAAAPPAPPAEAKAVAKPAQTPIAPAASSVAAPTLAGAKPSVAPPKPAEVAAVPEVPQSDAVPAPSASESSVVAAAPAPAAPTAEGRPAAGPPSANAVIDQVETTLVVRGDNLWDISRVRLGNGMRYTQIYAQNVSQIRNPNLIYPGQVFVMPKP